MTVQALHIGLTQFLLALGTADLHLLLAQTPVLARQLDGTLEGGHALAQVFLVPGLLQGPGLARLLQLMLEFGASMMVLGARLVGQPGAQLAGAQTLLVLVGRDLDLATAPRQIQLPIEVLATTLDEGLGDRLFRQTRPHRLGGRQPSLLLGEVTLRIALVALPETRELDRAQALCGILRAGETGDPGQCAVEILTVLVLQGFAEVGTHRGRLEQLERDQREEENRQRRLRKAVDRLEVRHARLVRAHPQRLQGLGACREGQARRPLLGLRGGHLGTDAVHALLLFQTDTLELVGARTQTLFLIRDRLRDLGDAPIDLGLFVGQRGDERIDTRVPLARLRTIAFRPVAASVDLVAEALLCSGQLGAQHRDLRGVLGRDLITALPLGIERAIQTLDLLLQWSDQPTVARLDLLGTHGDLRLESRIALGVILLDQALVVAFDVVGADQLGQKGRGHIERDRHDQHPNQQTEKPACTRTALLRPSATQDAPGCTPGAGRTLGHDQRGVDDPDDREHEHEHEETGDRPQPGRSLRDDRGTDETPDDAFDAGHQQDDDPGEAEPNRNGRCREAIAVRTQPQRIQRRDLEEAPRSPPEIHVPTLP